MVVRPQSAGRQLGCFVQSSRVIGLPTTWIRLQPASSGREVATSSSNFSPAADPINAPGTRRQEAISIEKIAGPLVQLLRRREAALSLEQQLRDFLFAKARVFTSAGDLTTLYGFIPVVAQVFLLSEEFDCVQLTDPLSALPAGLALLARTLQLQLFSVVLLGVSCSQRVNSW